MDFMMGMGPRGVLTILIGSPAVLSFECVLPVEGHSAVPAKLNGEGEVCPGK